MRSGWLLGFTLTLSVVVTLGAQPRQESGSSGGSKPATPAPPKSLTLSGCIQPGESEEQTTFVEGTTRDGRKYRLSGADAKPYIGRRVKITGGLVPSPNVAAQAGAIDPSQAAAASRGGAGSSVGTGTAVLEFKVRRVVPIKGNCPPQ